MLKIGIRLRGLLESMSMLDFSVVWSISFTVIGDVNVVFAIIFGVISGVVVVDDATAVVDVAVDVVDDINPVDKSLAEFSSKVSGVNSDVIDGLGSVVDESSICLAVDDVDAVVCTVGISVADVGVVLVCRTVVVVFVDVSLLVGSIVDLILVPTASITLFSNSVVAAESFTSLESNSEKFSNNVTKLSF
jgi:hypothetical protein